MPTTIEAPQEPEKVETVKETPKKVEAPQKVTQVTEPEELATPSIEDLIIEYGWSKSPYRESIGFIMGNLPQYFTENKREASFKYLYDICESNTDERLNISFCFTFLRAQGWTEKAWDDLVKIPALESKLFD